jgi:hypothetical protein
LWDFGPLSDGQVGQVSGSQSNFIAVLVATSPVTALIRHVDYYWDGPLLLPNQ